MPELREYATIAKTNAHRRKVALAQFEIERAAKTGNFVVCSSWGKDSCVLVGLVLSVVGPGFDVVHLESPYELPGYDRVLDWFRARCVVHTVRTSKTLDEYVAWLRRHGLHYERERGAGSGKTRKRNDLLEWVREQGYAAQLLGMRAEESKGRRTCFRVRGLTYPAHGLTCSNPIGWWTIKDVWAYLVANQVPWHPLYDCETNGLTRETLRNSGWLSVHAAEDGRVAWLRRHYPDQWRMLRERFPQVGVLG